MSEYIVKCIEVIGTNGKPIKIPDYIDLNSEIVRCRDCTYFYEDRRDTSIGWVSVFMCDSEQWSTSSLMPSHEVEPDGFCAWGERKQDV